MRFFLNFTKSLTSLIMWQNKNIIFFDRLNFKSNSIVSLIRSNSYLEEVNFFLEEDLEVLKSFVITHNYLFDFFAINEDIFIFQKELPDSLQECSFSDLAENDKLEFSFINFIERGLFFLANKVVMGFDLFKSLIARQYWAHLFYRESELVKDACRIGNLIDDFESFDDFNEMIVCPEEWSSFFKFPYEDFLLEEEEEGSIINNVLLKSGTFINLQSFNWRKLFEYNKKYTTNEPALLYCDETPKNNDFIINELKLIKNIESLQTKFYVDFIEKKILECPKGQELLINEWELENVSNSGTDEEVEAEVEDILIDSEVSEDIFIDNLDVLSNFSSLHIIEKFNNNNLLANCTISTTELENFIYLIKYNSVLKFRLFIDLIGKDNVMHTFRFSLAYIFKNIFGHDLLINTCTNETLPVQSIVKIFWGAEWPEREVWDLFGVAFTGHSDLRRILTDYGFKGHPLRKDFPLSGFFEPIYSLTDLFVKYVKVEFAQQARIFN